MPFIGKDWRSPGEAWVKTETLGWQRMKIIESQLRPACHPNPACSWPPRSEFGQHMATHCGGNSSQQSSERHQDSSPAACSGSGSGSGSVSPSSCGSPTLSPSADKATTTHRIHPITISSPYGQFTCCNHHFEPPISPPTSPTSRPRTTRDNNNTLSGAQVSRSLSREQLTTSEQLSMRYSNSLSDFRTSPVTIGNFSEQQTSFAGTGEQAAGRQEASTANNGPCNEEHVVMRNSRPQIVGVNSSECDQQQPQQACCCCAAGNSQQPSGGCKGIPSVKEPYVRAAPHCRVSVRTREVAMYNTISEAFYRLDFCNAIHDIRRFNYICKLLHLLITQNLTSLSGCATKVLFNMLEQVAWEVSINKRNIHVLKDLLNELKQMIQKYYCWGRPIGSSLLWQQHFDTIERISQMVDGIELSEPQNDETRITFNNLPVEMIREILLRLNDYRDLVNSAQASPVMRSMIDGQYIWQQLCRYHFTEQQLKMALDSRNSGLFTKRGNNLRGVKYARTTSADGKTSFRNPVAHKPGETTTTTAAAATAKTAREQSEQLQTNGRRNLSGPGQDDEVGGDQQRPAAGPTSSASYVTRAIRIFDKAGSSTTSLGSARVDVAREKRSEQAAATAAASQASDDDKVGGKLPANDSSSSSRSQGNRLLNSNRSNHEIDWERVFHQLRKKFDLKEEYADCLLLCRHCRCLFWKSFGHPCIRNDADEGPSFKLIQEGATGGDGGVDISNCDGVSPNRRVLRQQQQRQESENSQVHQRVSVAMLSRNFDNGPQRVRLNGNEENLSPPPPPPARVNENNPPRHLGAGRGGYVSLANRRLEEERNSNNNNSLPVGPNARRQEPVPTHVAISPQAFLKFFSL